MQVIDLTYLHSISDGDRSLEDNLIEIFLQQLPEFENDLSSAYADDDFVRLAAAAHKAKSSILAMGMTACATSLKRLEMLCKLIYIDKNSANSMSDSKIDDYQRQIDALPDELKTWIYKNKSQNVVIELINFYKLQAELAKADLSEYGEANQLTRKPMIEVTENEALVVVTVVGTDRITVANVAELKTTLTGKLKSKVSKVVLDLANVKFMDSTGISVLISSLKASRENGNKFAIRNVNTDVMRLFELMKLDKIFEIE
ncbi:MAG: STAS domain-containing protein [Bacteroidales bacterium]|nr:STAS domain-containing protein [Bacteroidales bacterium]